MLTALTYTLLAAAPESVTLPGGPPVSMDALAYDPKNDRIWAPAGNTGRVDVFDVKTGTLTALEGFEAAKEPGTGLVAGPSSVTVGDGFVYVGNRGTSAICAVDARTLQKKGCVGLPSMPDGAIYVAATREVWVTTPRDNSISILDVKKGGSPKLSGKVAVEAPEGLAVDATRGLLYTNLEALDRTAVFDVKTRKRVATWSPGCGKDGPRGLAFDPQRRHLFVACAAGQVKTLDAGKDGAVLGELEAGEGLDNIDYVPSTHYVYAASGRAGTLTIAEAAENGALTQISVTRTAEGARTVVAGSEGTAWVADSKGGRLILVRQCQ